MPTISADFTKVDGFKPVPAGEYLVEVANVEVTQTQAGDPSLKIQYKIVDGEYASKSLFDQMLLDHHDDNKRETVLAYTQRDLEILLDKEIEGKISFDTNDLLGAQAVAVVTQSVWKEEDGGDGRIQNRISRLKSANITGADSLF